jgi:hypothetical protein
VASREPEENMTRTTRNEAKVEFVRLLPGAVSYGVCFWLARYLCKRRSESYREASLRSIGGRCSATASSREG